MPRKNINEAASFCRTFILTFSNMKKQLSKTSFQSKYFLLIAFTAFFRFGNSQELKGLYVDDFKSILGNTAKEAELLNYAKCNAFNYLILYNTTKIHRELFALDKEEGSKVWAHFIRKAKTQFNITQIGIVGEKADSFLPAIQYNKLVANNAMERIDVFDLEFEFWNERLFKNGAYYCSAYLLKQGFVCSGEGAFAFYLQQLKEMNALTKESEIAIETYIGNPTDDQLKELAQNVDRLLIHYYREKIDYLASYKLNRLLVLQSFYPKLKIAPIFSSRENHLGYWLKDHPIDKASQLFFKQLKSIKEIRTEELNFDGIVWYRYSDMPKKI